MLAIGSCLLLVVTVGLVAVLVLVPLPGAGGSSGRPDGADIVAARTAGPADPVSPAAPTTVPPTSTPAPSAVDDHETTDGSGPSETSTAEPARRRGATTRPVPAARAPRTGLLRGADFGSGRSVSVRSFANGNPVAVETTYQGNKAGMLRAAPASVESRFTLVWLADRDAWAMRSDLNGLWVSAEIQDGGNDTGMLRARASTPSDWELFDLFGFADGNVAFRMRANGKYVAAELGEGSVDGIDRTAMLRARSDAVSDWELFTLA